MSNELKEKVIIPAWDMIKDDSNVKKFYFIPGLFSVIFFTIILVYQVIYTYIKIFGNNQDVILKTILRFIETDLGKDALILLIIFLIVYYFTMPIFEAGIIKYINVRYKGKEISKSEAFGQGLYKFLPIFEYQNLFSEFKIINILLAYLFALRLVGLEYIQIVNYIFLFFGIFGIIINILFSYAKFFLIIENKDIWKAIGESIKLAILNPKMTIKLFFIIFVLNLRVILNFIIFLIFPILFVLAMTYITIKFLLLITLMIIIGLFAFLVFFLGYLTAVLDVLKVSIRYHAYEYANQNIKK